MDENKEEYCRAATIDDLKLLIKSLNENDVEYFLIGGYALFAHGYERATTDIDIIVPPTVESGIKVKKALMVLPEKAAKDIDPEWFVNYVDCESEGDDFGTIRVGDEILVDIMFNACGETYETLKQHSRTVYIEDIPIKTIDLLGLLKTKQTVREKDISDRNILQRALTEVEKEELENKQNGQKSNSFGPKR